VLWRNRLLPLIGFYSDGELKVPSARLCNIRPTTQYSTNGRLPAIVALCCTEPYILVSSPRLLFFISSSPPFPLLVSSLIHLRLLSCNLCSLVFFSLCLLSFPHSLILMSPCLSVSPLSLFKSHLLSFHHLLIFPFLFSPCLLPPSFHLISL